MSLKTLTAILREVTMSRVSIAALLLTVGLGASACTTVKVQPPSPRARAQNSQITLGVPPGHLPPPGECRVWIPGRPPGRQAPPRSCDGILSTAPAGSIVLYRPGNDRRNIRVRYIDRRRSGVVIRIRLFEAASGRFIREEDR